MAMAIISKNDGHWNSINDIKLMQWMILKNWKLMDHPKGRHQKKNCRKCEIGISYLTPPPSTEKVKNKRMKYWSVLDPPSPSAESEKFCCLYSKFMPWLGALEPKRCPPKKLEHDFLIKGQNLKIWYHSGGYFQLNFFL